MGTVPVVEKGIGLDKSVSITVVIVYSFRITNNCTMM